MSSNLSSIKYYKKKKIIFFKKKKKKKTIVSQEDLQINQNKKNGYFIKILSYINYIYICGVGIIYYMFNKMGGERLQEIV